MKLLLETASSAVPRRRTASNLRSAQRSSPWSGNSAADILRAPIRLNLSPGVTSSALPVHQGVDFFQLARGQGTPARRRRRLLGEAGQEQPGLADREARFEREPDEIDPPEDRLAVAALPGSAGGRRQEAGSFIVPQCRGRQSRFPRDLTDRNSRIFLLPPLDLKCTLTRRVARLKGHGARGDAT